MTETTITALPDNQTLSGNEEIPADQGATTVRVTT